MPIGEWHLLPPPAPDLQTRLGVEAIDPLVIDVPAFLAHLR